MEHFTVSPYDLEGLYYHLYKNAKLSELCDFNWFIELQSIKKNDFDSETKRKA